MRQQLKRMPEVPPYLGKLKTKTSRRTVELPETVPPALAQHIEMYSIHEAPSKAGRISETSSKVRRDCCFSPLITGHCTARTGRLCGVRRSDVLDCRPVSACMANAADPQRCRGEDGAARTRT